MSETKEESFIGKFMVLKGAVRELWLIFGTKVLPNIVLAARAEESGEAADRRLPHAGHFARRRRQAPGRVGFLHLRHPSIRFGREGRPGRRVALAPAHPGASAASRTTRPHPLPTRARQPVDVSRQQEHPDKCILPQSGQCDHPMKKRVSFHGADGRNPRRAWSGVVKRRNFHMPSNRQPNEPPASERVRVCTVLFADEDHPQRTRLDDKALDH